MTDPMTPPAQTKLTFQARKAYRARWNRLRREARDLLALMERGDCDDIDIATLASMRSRVDEICQCFHEFNAYRNAHEWIDDEAAGRLLLSQSEGER